MTRFVIPGGVKTVARWAFLGVCWAILLFLGACFAIMLPLNLVLIPCWISMATSVGALARTLFGEPNVPQAGGEAFAPRPAREGAPVEAVAATPRVTAMG